MSVHPESALGKVYHVAIESITSYVKSCQKLGADFGKTLSKQITDALKQKLEHQHNHDKHSQLGTYYQINPSSSSCIPVPQIALQVERHTV